MSNARVVELQGDIEELNALLKQANRKKVQDFLTIEICRLQTEITNIRETLCAADTNTPGTSTSHQKNYQIKLNGYGWDQSDKYVKIFVTLKDVQNLPKEQVFCELTERSMELYVKQLDNKDYYLVINKLLEPINVAESHWKQKTDMVVIFLAKSQPNVKWSHITEVEKKAEEKKASKFVPKPEMADASPDQSLMNLFKNMYDSGDDDMKRMIAKAWHEGQTRKKDTEFTL